VTSPAPPPAAPAPALATAALALARAFHDGATLWCWCPTATSHARHLAVEFLHPVIVGKRALPAIAVEAGGGADALRTSVRAGDVVVVVADGDEPGALDVATRAPAWGLEVIWLATGPPPPAGTAARVVALGAGAEDADVVCAYHLLWELAHVCLEHPGVLEGRAESATTCPACMDAGDLGEVERLGGPDAVVTVGGVRQLVDLSLVDPCGAGELVVVHAGVAIAKLVGGTRG